MTCDSAPSGPHPADRSHADAAEASRRSAAEHLEAAQRAAATVIAQYSTSFSLATALLEPRVRRDIRSLYALVRVADEIVDGAGAGAGLSSEQAEQHLDAYERAVLQAVQEGFSTDLVLHAAADTARRAGIGPELLEPFFAAMRMDLHRTEHDADSLGTYIYGSAEVIGLMCLRIFLADQPDAEQRFARLSDSARSLGAAFQRINFLRDLAADQLGLHRRYLLDGRRLTEQTKHAELAVIDDLLDRARAGISQLPGTARTAVQLAHDLFAELAELLRRTPAQELLRVRVRVPQARKAALAARAVARHRRIRRLGGRPEAEQSSTEPHRPGGPPGARRRRIVVVGGGVSGLMSAGLLARDGHQVTLLEARDQLGGRAGRRERDGFRFDTGPSWYLMPEVFDHAFRLLGSSADRELDLVRLDPAYRVYGQGQPEPVDIRSGIQESAAVFERLDPGSGRRLRRYLESARRLYDLAVQDFLYTSFHDLRPLLTPRTATRLPRLAWHLGRSLHRQSAAVTDHPLLRQVLGYPAVFLASEPRRVPSLYHLMSRMDLVDGVLYPQGGFTEIVAALARLARAQGAELRTGTEVTAIETADGAVTGVAFTDDAGRTRRLDADTVVAAADLHHVQTRLLPAEHAEGAQRRWDRTDMGFGAVLVLLGVRGELKQLAHHTLLFTRDWDANFDAILGDPGHVPDPTSVYVSRTSATDPTAAPAGHENLFVLVPVPADPSLGRGGDDGAGSPQVEAVADQVIAQIASWAGIPDLAERIVVRTTLGPGDFAADLHAWRGSALGPAHTLRQSALLRGAQRSRTVSGLHFAGGSTVPGVGLPMCLISAQNVLKDLRGETSTGPLPAPPADPGTHEEG